MGVTKGSTVEANKDAFTPPVLVLEVADAFDKRDREAWNSTTESLWMKVCKDRAVTYRSQNVRFAKRKGLQVPYEPKPSDIHGRFYCYTSKVYESKSKQANQPPSADGTAEPGLPDSDASSLVGRARLGGPHSDEVVASAATLSPTSPLFSRACAGAITARDHGASIAQVAAWFPNSASFGTNLTNAMLDRAGVEAENSKGNKLRLKQRRAKYTSHADPGVDFDYDLVAKTVFDAMDAERRGKAERAYSVLFRLGTQNQSTVEDSGDLCQRVLRSLEGHESRSEWVSQEDGSAVEPLCIVRAAVAGHSAATVTAAKHGHGAVFTSEGHVVAPGPGISGAVTKKGLKRKFIVVLVSKRHAGPSLDLYVQGQTLCGNNGRLVSEADSILTFVARRVALKRDQGLPTAPPDRHCFYPVRVDTDAQHRLRHYAKLNQALARLLLPAAFSSAIGTRTVLRKNPSGRNRIGTAAYAPCKSWFSAVLRNSGVKRGTDRCSCGEDIHYRSREQGGVEPPASATTDKATCPLTEHSHCLVPGLYIAAGNTQHTGHYEARLPTGKQKLRAVGLARAAHLRDTVSLPATAVAKIIRDEHGVDITGRQARDAGKKKPDPTRLGIVGLLWGLEELLLPHVVRWLCAIEGDHVAVIGPKIYAYELVVPAPGGQTVVRYEVSKLFAANRPGAFQWSVAESLLRGGALPDGVDGFVRGGTRCPPGHNLRADSVIWADPDEIRECCRCMSAAAFDTTHNTSDQSYTYLAMMFKNGHGRSVQGLHGMLRGETQAAFSSFYNAAYPLIYGRAVVGKQPTFSAMVQFVSFYTHAVCICGW
jgi:hypothetical protein